MPENSRYCKICEMFMECIAKKCPCCKAHLKTKPRNSGRRCVNMSRNTQKDQSKEFNWSL